MDMYNTGKFLFDEVIKQTTVPLARNFPWHASDALSIRASVLKLCTRQLRVRKNLHMHVAGAPIASQFLLFEVCT